MSSSQLQPTPPPAICRAPHDEGPHVSVLAVDPFAAIQAYVVGAPDAEWGEVLVAFIVGAGEVDELDAHVATYRAVQAAQTLCVR
jgi:hypothetical protein